MHGDPTGKSPYVTGYYLFFISPHKNKGLKEKCCSTKRVSSADMNIFLVSICIFLLSLTADGQVSVAPVLWRGRGSEETHGKQLQASPASPRKESAFL